MESLELPASVQSIAAAIDSARGSTDDSGLAKTSVLVVRRVLRQLSAEGWATRMDVDQWYGRGVYVRADPGATGLWWPTRKWHRARATRHQKPSTESTTQTAETSRTSVTGRLPASTGKREKSEVAKAVDRVIEANEAHYRAHKDYWGPAN